MKLILTLTTLLSFQLSFAQEHTKLNDGDIRISGAEAQITSVKPVCPRGEGGMTCMGYGSKVKVKIVLKGCLDTFGGHFSKFKIENGKGILMVGALNIANEASMTARCFTMPTKVITIDVPFEGQIKIENLNFRGNIIPEL